MANSIRRVDYFYVTVRDEPGQAYELLNQLARLGVSLMAFTAMPVGPDATQLALFPQDTSRLKGAAANAHLEINGPHRALLVQGDDELGAIAGVHARLAEADVNVYASNAVADGRGAYGYVIYIRPEEYDRAAKALGV
jgi:hypothetical protein